MKIAVVGSGISGMTAAYLLYSDFDIEVFEAADYIGGHTHTIEVTRNNQHYAVDTGFIVFNRVTYPNFCTIMDRLGVESQPTEMTFSVKSETSGLEYSPHTLNTLFIQRKNLFSPSYYGMILDIFRLRKEMTRLNKADEHRSIGQYLEDRNYSPGFIDHFIVPLGSSLWSVDPGQFLEFPLMTFVRFFKNHGFLQIRNPFQWLVIKRGSERYVEKLTGPFREKIRLNTPVQSIRRTRDHVELRFNGQTKKFDHVILAVHSDQAVAMLSDPSPEEQEILSAITYQENLTILHTDTTLLPVHSEIWSSWNYLIPEKKAGHACLTYDMNILQSIHAPDEFCVTLNRPEDIDPGKEIGRYPCIQERSPRSTEKT
jgi:predicted NAD/FAD-binding protein